MNAAQLKDRVNAGQKIVVRFTPLFEANISNDHALYAQAGMMATISAISDRQSYFEVEFNYSDFEEQNKPLESRDYNDGTGKYVLTAREAGMYHGFERVSFDVDEEIEGYFDFVDSEYWAVYDQYLKEKSNESYVRWLENRFIEKQGFGI